MESNSSFGSLPKEIVQQIFSCLDESVKLRVRATNRLFRMLLLRTDFAVPVNEDLNDMCNRLLKYYSTTLIGLNIKSSGSSLDEIAENISKLTNLSSLQSVKFTSDDQWFKLTALTNLYANDCADNAPSSVVSHWSNLTTLICYPGIPRPDFPFSKLRALKRLYLQWPDVDLTQNTNVTSLQLGSNCSLATVSNLVKLRNFFLSWSSTECSFFTALTDLEDLLINCEHLASSRGDKYEGDSDFLQFINSSRLTSLYVWVERPCYYGLRHLSRLTSLIDLTIDENEPLLQSCGIMNMAPLTNLTNLYVKTANINDYEEVTKLTKLQLLDMRVPPSDGVATLNMSLSTLTNLTYLNLSTVNVASIESDLCHMKHLTAMSVQLNDDREYKFFETVPIELFNNQGHVECDQFWSSLTKCTTLQSIANTCNAPEDSVIWSLTSLSYLTDLTFNYTGRINEQYFTLLTNLRTLGLKPLFGGVPIDSDWFKHRMTWLDELDCE